MIEFHKIRYKNLLSTGNVFTEINLNSNGATLIVGDNGAGKSTLLDALTYVLFNKAFRNINKPQLVNSINKKEMLVEVEFLIGRSQYLIRRGMKPNVFEIFSNGILLNQDAETKDYQEMLERQILKTNFKSFCQVVVLGSATFQPFMSLPLGQRREIIEDILDLQIFSTMNSLLKDKLQENNENILLNNHQQKSLSEKIKLIRQHMSEIQTNNESLISEKTIRINETEEKISETNTILLAIDKRIVDLNEKLKGYDNLSSKILELNKLKNKIESNIEHITNQVSFLCNNDTCPTCKQEIQISFKNVSTKERRDQIEESNKGVESLLEKIKNFQNKLDEKNEYKKELTELTIERRGVCTQISSFIDYRNNLQKDITSIKSKIERIDTQKLNDFETELLDWQKKLNDLTREKAILSQAGLLLKDGGIKSKIIKQYITVINKFLNKYLSMMEFFIQFELNEQFNETIKSRFRDEFSYASFSEGEKMRINLAVLFTWRAVAKLRNSINTNILIMDEIFDSSLDANGTEEFIKILGQLTSDINAFIISHKTSQISDKFNNVLKFVKVKNFSSMVN